MKLLRSVLVLCALAAPAAAAPAAFSVEVTGHGAPIVLIPGLSCGGDVWQATVDKYRASHELHVLTLAGFAGQPRVDGPLLPAVRRELAAYIRAHRLARPVLVGHSLGGVVALWLAATEPDLVGGVVVVDAVPFLPALMQPGATVDSITPRADALRTMMAALSPAQLAQENRQSLAQMITRPADADAVAAHSSKSDPKGVAQALYDVMTTDLRPQLAHVRAPTVVLIAAGGEDAAAQRKSYEEQYKTLAGHETIVAEHARHFIMLDDAPLFYRALDALLLRAARKA
jgi:pimeloyl-ACP methyl ester carboxylesterase